MADDQTRPQEELPASTAETRRRPGRPETSTPSPGHGLFRKRADAIGPAPIFFSVALGITFGVSLGLLLNQPIIGIVFGAMLGALYAAVRGSSKR